MRQYVRWSSGDSDKLIQRVTSLCPQLLLLIALLLLSQNTVLAAGLAIVDCQGFTRALKSVDPLSKSDVQFQLVDGAGNVANNVQVTITNSVTGQTVTATAQNGLAVFEGVESGTWVVSTAAEGIGVTSVSVSTTIGTVAAGGAIAGGAVAAGGAVTGVTVVTDDVINQVSGDNGGAQDDPIDGGGDPIAQEPTDGSELPPEEPPVEPAPVDESSDDDEECPCTPDDDPNTFDNPDDFFGSNAALKEELSPHR